MGVRGFNTSYSRRTDEYTRECLAIDVARRLNSENVLERLAELFVNRGVADHIPVGQRTGVHFSGGA